MNISILNKLLRGHSQHYCKSNTYCSPKKVFHIQKISIGSNSYYLFINRNNKLVTITVDGKEYQTSQPNLLLDKPVTHVKQVTIKAKLKSDCNDLVQDIQQEVKEYSFEDINYPFLTKSCLEYLKNIDCTLILKDSEYLFNIPLNINSIVINNIFNRNNNVYIVFKQALLSSLCIQHCAYDEKTDSILTNNYTATSKVFSGFIDKYSGYIDNQVKNIGLFDSFNLSDDKQQQVKGYCSDLNVLLTEENIKMVCKLKGWL